LVQPSQVNVGAFMQPLVQIEVLLPNGQVDTSSQAAISLKGVDTNGNAIEGNAIGGAGLTAANGVATVTGLVVYTPGSGHVLVASSSFASVTSQPFDAILEGAGSLASAPWQLVPGLTTPKALPFFFFLIDPVSPQNVYALANDEAIGIWKSADGGSTWQPASLGLTDANIGSIVIDPSNDQTLYCTTGENGVFKSTNGAASWTWSGDGTGNFVNVATPTQASEEGSLVFGVDPTNSQVVFGSTSLLGLNKTTNGGGHWTPVRSLPAPPSLAPPNAFAQSPADHELLYAACYPLGYKSTDGGATWTELLLNGGDLQAFCFALDPVSPSVVYVGYTGNNVPVYKSTDGGATFVASSNGINNAANPAATNLVLSSLSIDPASPQTLYALTDFVGAFVSTNGAASWSPLQAGASNNETITVFAMNSANGLDLIAETASGIWRSSDGGATWVQKSTGMVTTNAVVQTMAFAPSDPNTVYASIGGKAGSTTPYESLMKSSDGGATWTDVSSGLIATPSENFLGAIAIDPVSSSTVYAGSPVDLHKTTDGGATWTALSPGGGVLSLAIDPTTGTTLYAVVAETSTTVLRKSLDSGTTWTDANAGIPTPTSTVTLDPLHPSTLFACAYAGLFRSQDGATTWTQVLALQVGPPPAPPPAPLVNSVGIDPLNDQHVYASGLDATGIEQIYKSLDGGKTFSVIPTGYYNQGGSVTPDPFNEGTVYSAAANRGLLKTTNGGTSWTFARNGLWGAFVSQFVFDPAHPNTVYAVSSAGLFKTTTGGQ
jgi:photosystem II stability/assembly factor-like uncharacterized protein